MVLQDQSRQYCDACLPEYRQTQNAMFSDAAQYEAARNAVHPDMQVDEKVFRSEILPGVQGVALSTLLTTTGLSQQYCSLIRRGLKVPHRRHWRKLSEL